MISYENNEHSLKTTAEAYLGKRKIHGRLPVMVNSQLRYGTGIDLDKKIEYNNNENRNSLLSYLWR